MVSRPLRRVRTVTASCRCWPERRRQQSPSFHSHQCRVDEGVFLHRSDPRSAKSLLPSWTAERSVPSTRLRPPVGHSNRTVKRLPRKTNWRMATRSPSSVRKGTSPG